MKLLFCIFFVAVINVFAAPLSQAEKPSFYRFDLGSAGLQKLENGNYLWNVPANREYSKISFDLDKLGIMPNEYDEIRIQFRNRKGTSMSAARITNYPATDQLRSWYAKISMPENRWLDLRFDLRLDDDGWNFGNSIMDGRKLEITLHKKYKRTHDEPAGRETEVSVIELIRRKIDLTFEETAAKLQKTDKEISWTYQFIILNRETVPQTIALLIETDRLKHFKTDWKQKTLRLAPRETITIPLTLSISSSEAAKLPPLYSERVLPKAVIKNSPPVFPLIGYRPRYVWATVPPENVNSELAVPSSEKDKKTLIANANHAVAKPFTVAPQNAARYCTLFKPHEMEALSFYRVRDKKTGKDLSGDPNVTGAYIYHHNEQTFKALKLLAQAYKLTNNSAYAEKIRDILLEYVHWFQYLPPRGPSATSGGSRLTGSTLDLSYFFTFGVEGYAAVKKSPVFGNADREKIETLFFAPLMMNLYSHNIEFTNMQLHHIANYGSAAICLNRYWNLLGDALYGDHGFYSFVDNGFTADGIALEGGVYHPFGLIPLLEFAAKIRACGIELVGEKFKRIYDHGITCTPYGVADGNLLSTYPLAWRIFRDPKYLPTLKVMKQLPKDVKPQDVPDTLFLGNTHQKNNGYLWLREKSPYGLRALAVNYIMGWDRMEHDRLHFRLFDDHGMVSHEVHRVGYTNPGADMEATVSHNTIVVDEQSSAPNPSTPAAFIDRAAMPGFLITENKESRLYPNVNFSRAVAIFDGIFFVGDKLLAIDNKTHTFDWPFYPPWQPWAKEGMFDFTAAGEFKMPFKSSYKFVKSAFSSPAAELFACSVPLPFSTLERGFDVNKNSDRSLALTVALPQETTAVNYKIGRGHNPKPGPMLLLRQKGNTASYGVAFEIVKNGGAKRVKSVKAINYTPADPLSAVWEIVADSGTYYVIINRTGRTLRCGELATGKKLEIIKK